jgi:hypothetical protein
MSMGEIGNVDEFKSVHELKMQILEQYKEDITEEEFLLSMGTS